MREIEVSRLTDVIEKLCIEANEHLPEDVKDAIKTCRACEDGEIAKGVLDNIIENFDIADSENVPICQDTGMACVFLEIGQDVHFTGGDLNDAINEGVRRCLLRKNSTPQRPAPVKALVTSAAICWAFFNASSGSWNGCQLSR